MTACDELRAEVDTLIVIPNQRLLARRGQGHAADRGVRGGRRGAAQGDQGHLGPRHRARPRQPRLRRREDDHGRRRATRSWAPAARAARTARSRRRSQAVSSPLLEDVSISGATGVLLNITGGRDLTLHEVNEAVERRHRRRGRRRQRDLRRRHRPGDGRRARDHGHRDRASARRRCRLVPRRRAGRARRRGAVAMATRRRGACSTAAPRARAARPSPSRRRPASGRTSSWARRPVGAPAKASIWRPKTHTVHRPTRFGGDRDSLDMPAFIRNQQR